ncbi:MAG: DUF1236 domain-containing protein [Rhizobiaceae bacterium]
MKQKMFLPAVAAALLASTFAASAQSMVTASTDLNVRSGPGPQFPVVGVIGAGAQASLDGCVENSKWCAVNGGEGWVYSDYLVGDFGGQQIVVTERPADSGIDYVPAPEGGGGGAGAVGGVAAGAITGAIVGGPIGAVVGGAAGGVAGGALGQAIDPPNEAVTTYVRSNTLEPVYLDGEVVVGATLPDTVQYREIPDYEYRYAYVNGQPVIVEPSSRRIVYIVR